MKVKLTKMSVASSKSGNDIELSPELEEENDTFILIRGFENVTSKMSDSGEE